jgi:hypothetical protein
VIAGSTRPDQSNRAWSCQPSPEFGSAGAQPLPDPDRHDHRPALTTVRQPFERITRAMVRLLLDLIAGDPPAAALLPTELVVRDST